MQQSCPDQQVPPNDLPGPDFLGRAVDKVKKAIEADNITDYERAYELYYQALELFLLALKWEKNSRSKELIKIKVGEYMGRADKLRAHLQNSKKKKPQFVETRRMSSATKITYEVKSNVKWEDVAGLDGVKEALKNVVIFPIKFPQLFSNRRLERGILLYGPAGSGKSYLASALATEAKSRLFHVSSPALASRTQEECKK
jgi:vacuolar protein-sorting-associated protein 4